MLEPFDVELETLPLPLPVPWRFCLASVTRRPSSALSVVLDCDMPPETAAPFFGPPRSGKPLDIHELPPLGFGAAAGNGLPAEAKVAAGTAEVGAAAASSAAWWAAAAVCASTCSWPRVACCALMCDAASWLLVMAC
jgi:hypothetical protein